MHSYSKKTVFAKTLVITQAKTSHLIDWEKILVYPKTEKINRGNPVNHQGQSYTSAEQHTPFFSFMFFIIFREQVPCHIMFPLKYDQVKRNDALSALILTLYLETS